MKESIKKITGYMQEHSRLSILVGALTVLTLTGAIIFSLTNGDTVLAEMASNVSPQIEENGVVATVGINDATGSPELGNSWPAELISSNIVQVQPQREGTIVDWRVYVGEAVEAGEVLGHISAPPATPDIIKMLADQKEAVTGAVAQARVTDAYTVKEEARYKELGNAIDNSTQTSTSNAADILFPALASIRARVAVKQSTLRSVIERALAEQIAQVASVSDWRYVSYNSFNRQYGTLNQVLQNSYIAALVSLSSALSKKDAEIPLVQAQEYFALAVRVANNTPDDPMLNGFKAITPVNQRDFLDALGEYRDAQMALADKETEYRLMIQEKSAMLLRDQSMAAYSADAAQVAYRTVAEQINGGTAIIATRGGTVSAIYKKVGDLVSPDMAIATIAGGSHGFTVRMRIPSTSIRPTVGTILGVMRPGFPSDMRQAKLIGVGTALDDTGSYMADAVLTEEVNWPSEASVRVLAPKKDSITVKSSAVTWGEGGVPQVWMVSEGGRIFLKKITVGRTLGLMTEVYSGLENGDRYIAKPTADMHEDMLLDEILKTRSSGEAAGTKPAKEKGDMGGMPM